MNHSIAIVSTVLLALAVLATAAPVTRSQKGPPECWLWSVRTRNYVKLSPDGRVTADGQQDDDAALYVLPETSPQRITIQSIKSTPENPLFLIFEDGAFKSGSPLNGTEVFERVPVTTTGHVALRVVQPIQPDSDSSSGSGSGAGEREKETVNYYLGFSSITSEAGVYESISSETKFVFFPNHQ